MDKGPGVEHIAFTEWAISHGIKIEGVAPARFPGRRLGMIATRDIEEDEIILSVPMTLLLTIDSIPESFVSKLPPGTSIHGILAAFLTHGDRNLLKSLDPWRNVWPSWSEFEQTMPVFWPEQLRSPKSERSPSLLPPSISGSWNTFNLETQYPESESESTSQPQARYQNLLPQQENRLKDAWMNTLHAFPETKWEEFAYSWAIINSRSFYYLSPGKDEPEDWNDAIGLVPYADYFNHVDDAVYFSSSSPSDVARVVFMGPQGVHVAFDETEYTFTATKRYEKGEEVYMSYGSHSNDFLLVEYGFYLDNNPSDSIYLDPITLSDLTRAEKKELAAQGHLGNYQITSSGPSPSTVAAATIKYMSRKDWKSYVAGTSEKGMDGRKTAEVVGSWAEKYLYECGVMIDAIINLSAKYDGESAEFEATKEKLTLLLARWNQIQSLLESILSATTI
ncbi:hypothetical protein BJX70DRAFT_401611 [Aspergillus crustosus]